MNLIRMNRTSLLSPREASGTDMDIESIAVAIIQQSRFGQLRCPVRVGPAMGVRPAPAPVLCSVSLLARSAPACDPCVALLSNKANTDSKPVLLHATLLDPLPIQAGNRPRRGPGTGRESREEKL